MSPSPSPGILTCKVEKVLEREQIASHDPSRLPGDPEAVAAVAALPEGFRTVLVVDDNDLFRTYLRGVLKHRGFRVHEAADGEAALRVALEVRPWLILTDVTIPGLDGRELCRRVRRHSLIRHTPAVFLSGGDDYKDRYRELQAGADEYLSKEAPIRELLIRIQIVLKRCVDLGSRPFRGPGMERRLEVIGSPASSRCAIWAGSPACSPSARALGPGSCAFRMGRSCRPR